MDLLEFGSVAFRRYSHRIQDGYHLGKSLLYLGEQGIVFHPWRQRIKLQYKMTGQIGLPDHSEPLRIRIDEDELSRYLCSPEPRGG